MANYIPDEWNAWTKKSKDVPFETSQKKYGDGEEKLAAEYNTEPMGQNMSYDIHMPFGEKWEVKKLDSDNSFRLGIEVSIHYTSIIQNVLKICNSMIETKPLLTEDQELETLINTITYTSSKCKTSLLEGLHKHEVSNSNLTKANALIEELKQLSKSLDQQELKLFSSITGTEKTYPILKAYQTLLIEDLEMVQIQKLLKESYNKTVICNAVSKELDTFKESSLIDQLNKSIRRVFTNNKILVLVDKNKGYMPLKNLNRIICNRITSGNPRCKFICPFIL
jgi:hypothetical protein